MTIFRAIVVLSFLGLALTTQSGDGANDDNVAAFAVLCNVLRTAESPLPPSKLPAANTTTEQIRKLIRGLVDLLAVNQSLAEAGKGGEQTSGTSIMPGKSQSSSNSLCSVDQLGTLQSRRALEQKIRHINREADEIIEDLEKKFQAVNGFRESAEENLASAIYGDGAKGIKGDKLKIGEDKEQTIQDWLRTALGSGTNGKIFHDATPSGGHANSCGNTGDQKAGKTLINDFYCLCVGKERSSVQAPCATGIETSSGNGGTKWTKMGASQDRDVHHEEGWVLLKNKCPDRKHDQVATPRDIHEALARFRAALGSQVVTNDGKKAAYILGFASTGATGCSGDNSQVCVQYYKVLAGQKPPGIEWENRLRQAAESIEAAVQGETEVAALVQHLKYLQSAARRACEEAIFTESLTPSTTSPPSTGSNKPLGNSIPEALSGQGSVASSEASTALVRLEIVRAIVPLSVFLIVPY